MKTTQESTCPREKVEPAPSISGPLSTSGSISDPESDPRPPSERFSFQLEMFKQGVQELQQSVARIDDVLFKIKASAVTVWVALMGWSFSSDAVRLVPLGGIVIVGFWLLEGYFRGIQARYLASSLRLTGLLNDGEALDECFAQERFPENTIHPLQLPETDATRLRMYLRGIIAPGVSTLYLFLGFLNLLLFLVR